MNESNQNLWNVTLLSQDPGAIEPPKPVIIRAAMCDVQDNGSLLFRDERGRQIAIIAAFQWLMVERENDKRISKGRIGFNSSYQRCLIKYLKP